MQKLHFHAVAWLLVLVFSLVSSGCKKEDAEASGYKSLYAVRGADPGIYDSQGRFMILRGVNYNVLGDYWQANDAIPATKQYEPTDIEMMASYGFNCIRLLFSWSALEPEKGQYNEAYIQQIQTVISEAAKYDMYVMLDMHQDAWGKYIATPPDTVCSTPNKGWDGAPLWATITEEQSTCLTNGDRHSSLAVTYAFQNFWDNTDGIQDACINAWKHLVSATAHNWNVLGYDLFNEPSLGYKEPFSDELTKLGNFYSKLILAIRAAEGSAANEHIIFIENSITWKGEGVLGLPDPNFSSDNNLVAAPHHYFESIGNLPVTIEGGYNLIASQVAGYQSAIFIGEWGFFGNPANDVNKVKRFAAIEDQYFGSSTWWQWAQSPGDPHGISWDGTQYDATSMHLIELDVNGNYTGNVNEFYLNVLNRTRPAAIAGKPTALTSNPDTGEMHLEATIATEGYTDLWIPNRFGEPIITGTNISVELLEPVDGGYKAIVKVTGSYVIDVAF